jgi:dTDP-L-rhamnose 4-epimerase
MTRPILITGGAGFIGSKLATRLVRLGETVVVVDALHPQVHPDGGRPSALPEEVDLLPCDVTSPTSWDAVLKLVRPGAVVHLAAETGTGQSLLEASRHGRTNVVGTTELLDALARHDVLPEHILLASSRAVYGVGRWRTPSGAIHYPGTRAHDALVASRWDPVTDEGESLEAEPSRADRTEPRPSNVYAATKLAQEHVLQAWCAAMSVPLSVLRLQNVYGPGQTVTNSYTGVLTLFARLAAAGQAIDVYEDGEIIRDFVFVDDVVEALLAAIARPPKDLRTLDVGTGRPTTILEAARQLASAAAAPEPVISGRFRDGDVRAASCDTSQTVELLDWRPSVELDEGLGRLLEYVRAHDG